MCVYQPISMSSYHQKNVALFSIQMIVIIAQKKNDKLFQLLGFMNKEDLKNL